MPAGEQSQVLDKLKSFGSNNTYAADYFTMLLFSIMTCKLSVRSCISSRRL